MHCQDVSVLSECTTRRDTYSASDVIEFAVNFTATFTGDLLFVLMIPGENYALIVIGEQIVDDVVRVEPLQRCELGQIEHSMNISTHLIIVLIIIASTAAITVPVTASVAAPTIVVPAASATIFSVLFIIASEEAGQPAALVPVVVIAVAAIHPMMAVAIVNLDVAGLRDLDIDIRSGNGRSRQGGEDEGVTHVCFGSLGGFCCRSLLKLEWAG